MDILPAFHVRTVFYSSVYMVYVFDINTCKCNIVKGWPSSLCEYTFYVFLHFFTHEIEQRTASVSAHVQHESPALSSRVTNNDKDLLFRL